MNFFEPLKFRKCVKKLFFIKQQKINQAVSLLFWHDVAFYVRVKRVKNFGFFILSLFLVYYKNNF
jgi:hypothetical protein